MEKVLTLFLDEVNKGKVKNEDLSLIFKSHPKIINGFLNNYWKLPIKKITGVSNLNSLYKDEKDINLVVPAINLLLYSSKIFGLDKEILKYFPNAEPFKEVYIEKGTHRDLIHGFDFYSIADSKNFFNGVSLTSLTQFYAFIKKMQDFNSKVYSDYRAKYIWDPDGMAASANFKVSFEDFFINNWQDYKMEKQDITIHINNEKSLIRLNYPLKLEVSNLHEAEHLVMQSVGILFRHKVAKNEIDFEWDTDKIIQLVTTKNHLLLDDKTNADLLKKVINNNPYLLNQDLMTVIYLKNKELYNMLKDEISSEELTFMENTPDYILERKSMDYTIENWNDYIKQITKIITPFEETDPVIFQTWKELEKQILFMVDQKGIEFFEENVEDKILFEQMLSKYLPTILNNYFSIPNRLRLSEKADFKNLTNSQLLKIHSELEQLEIRVLEDELRKMKGYGRFLEDRMPAPGNSIINLK